jgi:hypothetical protein
MDKEHFHSVTIVCIMILIVMVISGTLRISHLEDQITNEANGATSSAVQLVPFDAHFECSAYENRTKIEVVEAFFGSCWSVISDYCEARISEALDCDEGNIYCGRDYWDKVHECREEYDVSHQNFVTFDAQKMPYDLLEILLSDECFHEREIIRINESVCVKEILVREVI